MSLICDGKKPEVTKSLLTAFSGAANQISATIQSQRSGATRASSAHLASAPGDYKVTTSKIAPIHQQYSL